MILNLTQHLATPEQKAAGVRDLPEPERKILIGHLTFAEIPTTKELLERAQKISTLAATFINGADSKYAMIGGAPFLMSVLESSLMFSDITPLYAFSKRVVEEKTNADGTVEKISVFKHAGFVGV